jgi:cytosol alanyl aminopeptidase
MSTRHFRVILACAGVFALGSAFAKPTEKVPNGMLPAAAEPLAYTLHFDIDPAQESFDGTAEIRVQLKQAVDHLWLNGKGLSVSSASLTTTNGRQAAVRYTEVNKDGVARVDFGKRLKPQALTLRFAYSAHYATDLEGLYKVKRGSDAYVMTQMESLGARKAFPGFDEPRFKTPFTVSMTVPDTAVAVANSRQLDETLSRGHKTLRFATTEKLPTYLLAVAVGPWDVTETLEMPPTAERPTPLAVRVLGPKGSKPKLQYALTHTPTLVTALERYFGIAYPFDKLDLLAAPDFAAGAMENAGLVTFADTLIVLDEKSSLSAIKSYTSVTAHELAHQWFGDLVTPRWWDDIWLNEAFATWMAAKIVGEVAPEQRPELDQLRASQAAMTDDSLVSARRIREPIRVLGDIDAAFDGITYQKGAAVLSTFENWIGAENFRRGVHAHMVRHARGVATADHLIAALAEASGKGAAFAPAMKSFLDQPGLPQVAVTPQCAAGKASLALTQQRYLPLGSSGKATGQRWQIPVCMRLGAADGSSGTQCTLLDGPRQSVALAQCPAWVLPNADAGGYYRFTLPPEHFKSLITVLPALKPAEQLAVTDAVTAAFQQGTASADTVLATLRATADLPLPQVALAMRGNLDFLRLQVLDAAGIAAMRKALWSAYEPVLARLTLKPRAGESADDKDLRAKLVSWLAIQWQMPELQQPLLESAGRVFAGDGRPALDGVPPDLLTPTLAVWARAEGATAASRLRAELALNTDPAQRRSLVTALAVIEDTETAIAVRDFSLDPDLQLHELYAVLATQADNRIESGSYWSWFTAHLPKLRRRLPGLGQARLVDIGARGMCSTADAAKLAAFFDAKKLAEISGGARNLRTAREEIGLCAALAAHNAGYARGPQTP